MNVLTVEGEAHPYQVCPLQNMVFHTHVRKSHVSHIDISDVAHAAFPDGERDALRCLQESLDLDLRP